MSAVSKALKPVLLSVILLLGLYMIITPINTSKLFKHTSENRNKSSKDKTISEDKCNQIFPCLTNGRWSLKKDLSPEDVQKRIKMDEYISEYEGFPKTTVRSDGKCGRNFPPTPNGKGSSVCDAYGLQPCCNEDLGRCGNTIEFCKCKNCTDFRNYLPAEIAQWTTNSNKCRMKEFNHVEACRFFSQHISEMLFLGDSLTRHIFTALALILTNDTEKGALSIKKSQKEREQCQGELQCVDRGKFECNLVVAHRWDELPTVCAGNANFTINLEQIYNEPLLIAKNAVRRLLNKTGSIVLFNFGLHMDLNSKFIIDNYVGPIVDMVKNNSNGWPKMIWHTLHGIEDVLRYDVNEIFTKWRRFNAEMGIYMERRGIDVMDSEQLTRGIRSYDARHFGVGANMLKVQVLMNYLEQWFQMCKKYEVREWKDG